MKRTRRIVVIGSANTDLVITTERFPRPGETLVGRDFLSNRGGKGANQAVAAARLGGDVAFVGKVGTDDYGRQTLAALSEEGIDTRYTLTTGESHSGIAIITVDTHGENTIIVDGGANSLLSAEDIQSAEELFHEAAIVLMQLETPVEALTAAARLARHHGAFVVLNPAPAPQSPLPAELLENVDLLIPNQTETEAISGIAAGDLQSAKEAIERLRQMGVRNAIITMGGEGVAVGPDATHVPSYPTTVVDTTAAGDTFCGALCTALAQGKELSEAAHFACRAAAVTVSRMGAQQAMPYLRELDGQYSLASTADSPHTPA